MNTEPTSERPIRLWPGVAAAVVVVAFMFVLPVFVSTGGLGVLVGAGGTLVLLVWWLFFSRAPWAERLGAVLLMVAVAIAARPVVHVSVANAGMGRFHYFFIVILMCLGLVAAVAASRRLSRGARRAAIVAGILLAGASLALVRTEGVRGAGGMDFRWRWTRTPEERLLAQGDEPVAPAPVTPAAPSPAAPSATAAVATPSAPASGAPAAETSAAPATPPPSAFPAPADDAARTAEWPGFRGPGRDGVVRGVHIETDWTQKPPVALWRRPIGPGWSSFAVDDSRLYTQEQRGEEELVSAYDVRTGQPAWRHRDKARFWESNAGPGPRATPTLAHGRVYALGGTGILNALDARDGKVVWSRNAASDTGAEVPIWGFAGSPLVFGDTVIVATSGRIAAYDAAAGAPRWFGPKNGGGYSSPHLTTIGGVPQVLLLRGARTTSFNPADGTLLWEHSSGGATGSIVQPGLAGEGEILIATNDAMGGNGIRRIGVAKGPGGWTVQERWTTKGLKPYFNDFVVHEGHAYGFDGSILACIDLADGQRKWKGGRFGNGQLVLLPDQDVLLVLSEDGELGLVKATPDQFTELARVPALEGKTWNHPALAGDVLLVRNGEQMAAFRLPVARQAASAGGEPSAP
jgi:outer membrane protein assembly factor BamB